MLTDEQLLLALRKLAKAGQRLPVILVLSQVDRPALLSAIREKAVAVGFRDIAKWNIAQSLLVAAKDQQVAQLAKGWKILEPGLKAIEEYYKPEAAIIRETRHALKSHLDTIQDKQRRMFIEESIKAFDVGAFRAAIVLSWVGAVHILQEHIIAKHKAAFNAAGAARMAKAAVKGEKYNFAAVKSLKDFGVISEAELLQLCQDAGIIHKAEKQALGERLDLRNQSGHPNPMIFAEHVVASHIELLMLNVYSKY
jgi:hypothetical protein